MPAGGRGRLWPAGARLAAAAGCVFLVVAFPAHARPAAAQTQPSGGLDGGCDPTAPTPPAGAGAQDQGDRACSTLMEKIVPGEEPGPYPTSHYDIGYDEG